MEKFSEWDGKTVLVVDDSEAVVKDVVKKLKVFNFARVLTATDGEEAWELIKFDIQQGNKIDLIISDINMPKKDGIALLESVRVYIETKDTPFVILSTERDTTTVLSALSEGATNYIIKPVDSEILKAKLIKTFNKPDTAKS